MTRVADSSVEHQTGLSLARKLNAAEDQVAELLAALKASNGLCSCGGTGTRTTSCSLCGDSTYDHVCDDRDVPCERAACVNARAVIAKFESGS